MRYRYDEIYPVNESCLGQQPLRAICITADAIRSSTAVKLKQMIHDVFDLCFHVGEKLHAVTFNLEIPVKPYYM
jgi:hypothetical protein